MSDEQLGPSNRQDAVNEDFAAYLQSVEAGRPARHALLTRHPAMEPVLDDYDRFDSLATPLRELMSTIGLPATPEEPPLPPGTRVGDYEVLEEIGRNGQGIVYKARHVKFNHIVALKMLLSGHRATEKEAQRFIREIENQAKLDHPNIVPIKGGGEHEGRLYFTMKLIEGGDLAERAAGKPMSPREAAELVAKIARAVHHAHQRSILHRDLKPSNILLDAEGQPYVADFGLCKRIGGEEPTETGYMVGAPAFIAPEQIHGQTTVLSDVYGLGTIFYWALTGRRPVAGETWEETLRNVRERKPEPPHARNPQLNHWRNRCLEIICLHCLEKDPDCRYQSAEALGVDLERWLRYEPPRGVRVRKIDRLRLWWRRNPAVASLTGVVAVLLICVVVAALSFAHTRHQMLQESLKGASRIVAENVRSHFDHLSHPLLRTAEDERLPDLLKPLDKGKLQEFVKTTLEQYNDWYGLANARVFRSFYVLDGDGEMVAISPLKNKGIVGKNQGILGRKLGFRDYFQYHKQGRTSAAYVSRIFKSANDGYYKFAISAAVREEDGTLLGVVAATVSTASKLGSRRLSGELTAVLVGLLDPRSPHRVDLAQEFETSGQEGAYVIFIHPEYGEGEFPREVSPIHNESLLGVEQSDQGVDAHYEDLLLPGGWIAASTRVNENFVVIVQQRHR